MSERSKILIVGGYGEVGRSACADLAQEYPGLVVAAGRSLNKAEAYAHAMQGRVLGRALDVRNPPADSDSAFSDVHTVIMCVDQSDTRLVETFLAAGINYIDVTATYGFIRKLKNLQPLAVASGATAVVGVGLAPGLTTLLAAGCIAMLEHPQEVDISLLAGAGDTHGEAAIRWTMENLLSKPPNVSSKVIDFGAPWGKRTALPFAFSDQHAISKTMGIAPVVTRLAMDSRFVMTGFRFLRYWNPNGRLRSFLTSSVFARILGSLRIGSDAFVAKVEAYGRFHNYRYKASASCAGRREAEVTGLVAAAVVKAMLKGRKSRGVFDVHELFDFAEVYQYMSGGDIIVEWPTCEPIADIPATMERQDRSR